MAADGVGGDSVVWSLPIMTIPPEDPPETGVLWEGTEIDGSFVFPNSSQDPETSSTSDGWNSTSLVDDYFNNCSEPLQHVEWADPRLISSLVILVAINGLVIAGNVLVIMAVFSTPKLRTVTNLFIASLAVADLLLGMAVLPFSVTVEVFRTWLFGELWCSVWLAVDVWMSTSSILNLCVISLDRYVAVTRPVKYPSLMTSRRAKMLIAGVWVASFVICFPPLVGWNDRHKNLAATDVECVLTCELTNDFGYVLYSAMGSFFIPMLVMLFFYWKIYLAAVETTKAINRGFRTTTKGNQRFDEERVTLRIHVGRNSMMVKNQRPPLAPKAKKFSGVKLPFPKAGGQKQRLHRKFNKSPRHFDPFEEAPHPSKREGIELVTMSSKQPNSSARSPSSLSIDTGPSVNCSQAPPSPVPTDSKCDNGAPATSKSGSTSRMGKRNIKVQVKRFKMETKAAKTLGIIVGVFIICWFPFFTMYLVRAFCVDCIHPLVFSVFFWLGYCNSALNPCIYALFSKDFRLAFKKILCRVICRKERRKWPLPIPGLYLASLVDESEDAFDPFPP